MSFNKWRTSGEDSHTNAIADVELIWTLVGGQILNESWISSTVMCSTTIRIPIGLWRK